MRRALRTHGHSYAGCTQLTLSAGGKKSIYAHEGTLHLPTAAHLLCFISFCGKKSHRILFEQPTYIWNFHLSDRRLKYQKKQYKTNG